MNNIYSNYINRIQKAIDPSEILVKSKMSEAEAFTSKRKLWSKEEDEILFNSLGESLQSISATGVKKYHERPGQHPDFQHIRDENYTENHYITSVFIDVKNSTGLFKKYSPLAVANITTTIQRAAIHTCWYFNGYIHRFHGDGLMIYFGGRGKDKKDSIVDALNATSLISYFIKNELKKAFLEDGVENISTRIGIDIGNDQDVLWHLAGMGDCSEVTTCSLHTSLASHMQSNASTNGIMIGDNGKAWSQLESGLFSIKKDNSNKELRYIYEIPEKNFRYAQWEFNWEHYLKKFSKFSDNEAAEIKTYERPAIVGDTHRNA
jgi:class 3 adenylate cyclase